MRVEFINGLRQLVTFLEDNPQIPMPYGLQMNVFLNEKNELIDIARRGSWEKNFTSNYFSLKKDFGGGVTFEVNIDRDTVCVAKVVGKRIIPAQPAKEAYTIDEVEWECDPLLK